MVLVRQRGIQDHVGGLHGPQKLSTSTINSRIRMKLTTMMVMKSAGYEVGEVTLTTKRTILTMVTGVPECHV